MRGTFASGRPVTSEDVIASLERIILEGDTSLAVLSLEGITGFRAFAEGEAEHVSGLQALTLPHGSLRARGPPFRCCPRCCPARCSRWSMPRSIDGDGWARSI